MSLRKNNISVPNKVVRDLELALGTHAKDEVQRGKIERLVSQANLPTHLSGEIAEYLDQDVPNITDQIRKSLEKAGLPQSVIRYVLGEGIDEKNSSNLQRAIADRLREVLDARENGRGNIPVISEASRRSLTNLLSTIGSFVRQKEPQSSEIQRRALMQQTLRSETAGIFGNGWVAVEGSGDIVETMFTHGETQVGIKVECLPALGGDAFQYIVSCEGCPHPLTMKGSLNKKEVISFVNEVLKLSKKDTEAENKTLDTERKNANISRRNRVVNALKAKMPVLMAIERKANNESENFVVNALNRARRKIHAEEKGISVVDIFERMQSAILRLNVLADRDWYDSAIQYNLEQAADLVEQITEKKARGIVSRILVDIESGAFAQIGHGEGHPQDPAILEEQNLEAAIHSFEGGAMNDGSSKGMSGIEAAALMKFEIDDTLRTAAESPNWASFLSSAETLLGQLRNRRISLEIRRNERNTILVDMKPDQSVENLLNTTLGVVNVSIPDQNRIVSSLLNIARDPSIQERQRNFMLARTLDFESARMKSARREHQTAIENKGKAGGEESKS